jgi:hypothetical protein
MKGSVVDKLRRISMVAIGFSLILGLSGFGFKNITGGGGGGGGNWTAITKDWKTGLGGLAAEAARLAFAQADIAEALGLKQQAALLRSAAKNIKEKGDSAGGAELDELSTKSASAQAAINDKIKKTAKLSAKEKAAIVKGGATIMKSLVGVGKNVLLLVKSSKAASSAGAPSPSDFSAVAIAADIPALMPKAASAVPKLFETANDLRKYSKEKDIALPASPLMPDFG